MTSLLSLLIVAPALAAVDYTSQVRPILEKRCYACHGPRQAMHGLRLDDRTAALKGGDSGVPSLVPGKSASSLIYRYIAGLDKDVKMPPGAPMPAAEIDIIKRWIDEGAAWPASATAIEDEKFTRGRTHWAFQPRTKPAIPSVRNKAWVRNPIDAFVLSKLEAQNWSPSPQATPRQLLRRIHFDLTGLPPTLAEQDAFANHPSIDGVIDRLLQSPAYAERWARHWLDVVRYGESNGYERDGHKPQVWKYRDYVIRSFLADKPFDQFLTEQLAGDEFDELTPELLIATGYHRLGPWDDEPADPETDRYDQLDDIVSTTSQAFLGLTIGCARCHNHKFEPLTAADYYSMVSIFNGLQRPRAGRRELDMPVGPRTELEREAARDARIKPLEQQVAKLLEPYKNKKAEIPSEIQKDVDRLQGEIAAIRTAEPDLPRAYFMHEPKPEPPVTHLLIRGKPGSPGPEVPPAVPAILVKQQPEFRPAVKTSGRRLALARWMTQPDNPLVARVIVNRVWMWHFGEGLVRTPSDFGLMGQRPTHPELLDWLANRFIEDGWSFRKLHKLILSSSTWRMSKAVNHQHQEKDPEDRLLWRVPYRRLEAEAIRDAMLAVSGRLNRRMFGPSVFPPVQEQALEGSSDPDKIWKASNEEDSSRRSIYVFLKRSLILPMLDMLDLCDTARSAAQRMTTSVPTQALTLFNGDFVNQQARYLAGRLINDAGTEAPQQIDLAYRLALARHPTEAEKASMLTFLEKEETLLRASDAANARLRALEQLARVIFNLNEFVYVD